MRIAIDARELAGKPTGVGRYLAEILSEWSTMPEALSHELVFCAPETLALPGGLAASLSVEAGGGTFWEQGVLPRLARRAAANVLFCPGYSGPIFGSTPLVIAIHDVSFAAHPEWFRWREGLRRRVITRASARRASRVVTLTEFSKREIVEHLGIAPERIEVIHPGIPRLSAGRGVGPADREHLVLYVGSIFNRRHVPETIRGFERLARRHSGVRLTMVGDNRTHPRLALDRFIDARQHVELRSYVNDGELGSLYRRARAFVFLSEYEGFGLTPLEALATDVPIVVLDTPVAREVYGDAAIYIGAPDPDLIESALEEALFDDAARARVLRHAPAVVAKYSWRECASRVLAALTSVSR